MGMCSLWSGKTLQPVTGQTPAGVVNSGIELAQLPGSEKADAFFHARMPNLFSYASFLEPSRNRSNTYIVQTSQRLACANLLIDSRPACIFCDSSL